MGRIKKYLIRTSGLEIAPFVFLLATLYVALLGLGYWKMNVKGLAILLTVVPFFLIFGLNINSYLIIFISFVATIPAKYHGETYDIYPFYFLTYYCIPFVIIISFLYLINSSLKRNNNHLTKSKFDIAGLFIAIYIFLTLFSALRGMFLGNDGNYIYMHTICLTLFIAYFVIRNHLRDNKQFNLWIDFLFVLGFIVSIEYIYITIHNFSDIINFVLMRAVTQHGQLTIATIPITVSYFLFVKSKRKRSFIALVLFLQLIQIFLSQQRILWVAVAVEAGIFVTFYIFRNGFKLKSLITWFLIVLLFASMFFFIIFAATIYLDTDLDFLLKRWDNVKNLTDGSFMMRVYDIRHALDLSKNDWFWGLGMGATIRSIPRGTLSPFFDQSYFLPYFYGGIFLVMSIVCFYLAGIWRSFQIFTKCKNERIRMTGLAILTALAGQMISGMTDVTMIHLPHVIIWVLLIAIAVVMYEKYIYFGEPEENNVKSELS